MEQKKNVADAVSGLQLDFLNTDFLSNLANDAIAFISINGLRIIVAILVLFIGRIISRQLSIITERIMLRAKVDEILTSFIKAIIYYVLLAAFVVAALGQAGINITSFLAVLGAAGLAVGLALKDTLSNFAAGVNADSASPVQKR